MTGRNFCSGDTTQFVDQTDLGSLGSIIVEYLWDFGEAGTNSIMGAPGAAIPPGTNGGRTKDYYETPKHKYNAFDLYNVKLRVTTDDGCVDSLTRSVFIQDSPIPKPTKAYLDNFNSGPGSWVRTVADVNIPTDTSWVWGIPYGKGYTKGTGYQPANGDDTDLAWYTGKTDSTFTDDEKSVLIGPCLNLDSIARPMISLDYWSDFDNLEDGVVLQYSTDGGILWEPLGTNSADFGINWYNGVVINGFFNSQNIPINSGGYGWTGRSMEWKNARYSLDGIDKTLRSKIIFRLLLGTNIYNTPDFSGFAFDNIFVGEKKRNVMVEYFTNIGIDPTGDPDSYFDNLYNAQFPLKDSTDFFKIQYNMGNPKDDVINQENPYDPSARSLFYGISRPPAAIMDGLMGDYYTTTFTGNYNLIKSTDLERRSLESPLFDIQLTELASSTDSLKLVASFTYIDSLRQTFTSPVILQVGLVDGLVDVSGVGNVNVLRKLLLGTEGKSMNIDWALNQTETVTINAGIDVPIGVNNSNLYLIAFVQDSSKKILQAIKQKVAIKSQQQIVGVDDPLSGLLNGLHIYPNPASGIINFVMDQKIPRGYSYTITDQRGVRLLSGDLNMDLTVPQQVGIRDLADGIYFVSISRAGKPMLYRKIAVMNQN